MLLGGGRDNVIENNVMLDCHESIRFDNRGLDWAKDSVRSGRRHARDVGRKCPIGSRPGPNAIPSC